MALSQTFMMIKPDATLRGLVDEINEIVEAEGFRILRSHVVQMTVEQARLFRDEQKEMKTFDKICAYLASAPVVVQILEGEDAMRRFRAFTGCGTNPQQAPEGSLRRRFAEDVMRNAIHAADSPEAVDREISLFFGGEVALAHSA